MRRTAKRLRRSDDTFRGRNENREASATLCAHVQTRQLCAEARGSIYTIGFPSVIGTMMPPPKDVRKRSGSA
eukprot:195948-Pleurochrysis_carterae.AAC.2